MSAQKISYSRSHSFTAQRLGVELADPRGAAFSCDHEAGRSEQSQVFRDGRPAGAEVGRDAAHRLPAEAQQPQDFSARGIRDGLENGFGGFSLFSSHLLVTVWLLIR